MCIMHFSRCLICHQIVQYVCMCVYIWLCLCHQAHAIDFLVWFHERWLSGSPDLYTYAHTHFCARHLSAHLQQWQRCTVIDVTCAHCHHHHHHQHCKHTHTHTQTHFQCHWHCSPYQLVASLCFGCVWVTLFRLLESQNWKSDQSVCD